MTAKPWPRLSFEGYELLLAINEVSDEPVEPDDLADALEEAFQRIGVGCKACGDSEAETRFGFCYPCVFGEEAGEM